VAFVSLPILFGVFIFLISSCGRLDVDPPFAFVILAIVSFFAKASGVSAHIASAFRHRHVNVRVIKWTDKMAAS
jgi:hypothetical protein